MPEIPSLTIVFGIPVVGQFEQRRPLRGGAALVLGGGKKDQRVAAGLAVGPSDLLHAELLAVEVQALVDIGDANHRVEIAERHGESLLKSGVRAASLRCTRAW